MKTEELAAALEGQSIDHTPCDDCAVLRDAAKRLRQLERVKKALETVLRSAYPHPREQPTMWAAWQEAHIALGEVDDG